MKRLFFILPLVAILLPGCKLRPEKVPGNPDVTAAARQKSAQQPVGDARKLTGEADFHRDAARAQLDAALALLARYEGEEYSQLRALITRLREQGSASKSELEELTNRVYDQAEHITGLLTRIKRAVAELDKERVLRKAADVKLVEATARIAAKETEADQLRQQFIDQTKNAAKFEKNARDNHDAAVQAAAAADKAKGAKAVITKILIGVGVALLISIGFNLVQLRGRFPI